MDEITMFAELRPEAPDEADLDEMRARARHKLTARTARTRRPRWRVPVLAAGLTAAVATAATAAVVLTSAGPGATAEHTGSVVTAAWTVRENADGTVTIRIQQLADPARLQRVLREDGVNAFVRGLHFVYAKTPRGLVVSATCFYRIQAAAEEPQSVQRAVVTDTADGWIIHPSAMPHGSALFLFGQLGSKVTVIGNPVVLTSDKLPACVSPRS
jgi:hypothetical protein